MQKSLKKISRKSLSLLIALIMVFSALPLTPPISANAETTYTRTGYYDFTSDYVVGTTGSNAVSGYTGDNFKAYFKAWDRTGCVKSGTRSAELMSGKADDLYNLYTSVLSVKSGTTSQFYYKGTDSGYLQSVTPNIDGLYFRDGFFYLPNIRSYLGQTGFRISWTEQYYSKSTDSGAGVFSLGTGTNGDIVKWTTTTNDNSFYVGGSIVQSNSTPTSGHVYEITLSAGTDNLLNVSVYDRTSTQQIINYTSSTAYDPSTFNYLVIGSCNQASDQLGTFVLSNLTIEKGEQTSSGGSQPTPPTNKTASVVGYGAVKKSGNNRASGTTITIVNDRQDDNFGIGFVNFDISSLSNTGFNVGSAIYNMTYSISSSGREAMGLSFYYATKNDTVFNNTGQGVNLTDTGISDNVYGTTNQHIDKAKTYLGLQKIADVNTTVGATNASFSVDISPAIRYALSKGKTKCQLLIMLTTAGGEGKYNSSGQSDYWSDTAVTVNTSSVPVTMQTDEDYVKANIGSIKKSYSYLNANNAGTSYMNGIIYGDTWSAATTTEFQLETTTDKHKDKMTMYAYSNSVALYDGSTSIRFPIIYQKIARADYSSDYDVYQRIEHVALKNNNNSKFSLGNSTWQYCNDTTDFTSKTLTTETGDYVENISTNISKRLDSNQGTNKINDAKNDKFQTAFTKNFKNYISYSGTGNDESYYEKFSAPLFDYSADYALFWYDYTWGQRGWKLTRINEKQADISTAFNFYVLNYKPLYDIVKTGGFLETSYNEISNNSSKYSQEGLNNYYAVVADIIDFNLANESMTSESEVRAVAGKIKDLVNRYNLYKTPELNQYTVTFKTSDPNNIMAAPVIVKTVEVKPGTTVAASNFPELKATHYDKDNKHYVYYWYNTSSNTEFTSATKVDSNIEVEERRRLVACTYDPNDATCMSKAVCSVCKTKVGDLKPHSYTNAVFVAADGDNNSYTKYLCVNGCGQEDESLREYESTDWSTYDSQKRVLDDLLADRTKFTDASFAAFQTAYSTAISGFESDDETKSQTFIDNKVKELIAAKDLLKSTVTFKVYDDSVGGSPRLLTTESFDVKYLDSKQLDVPNDYSTEYAVTSWKRNINGVDSQIATNTSSILAVVSTNITYMVYLKKTTIDENQASSKAVITLNNKSNKVVDVAYVEKNSGVEVTVDVDNGSITVGGQTLKAPTYSFYRVTGFKINGKTVNTGTIDITGDFIIKPEYEARTSFIITGGNGVVEKSTTTSWDKRVRLTAETPAQSGKINEWTSTINNKTVVWGYGDTLSFQATQACTVECAEVDATEFDGAEDVKLSVDYVSYNLYRANSITAISRVVAPEGTVLEYGTILKTANIKAGATNANYETQKAAVNNKDNYKVENKSGVFKATQKISNTDQFAYNFYSAQDYDKMYVGAVAYAKLSNGTTVYSDVVTYEVR